MIWKILGYIGLIFGAIVAFLSNSEWSSVLIILGILLLNIGKNWIKIRGIIGLITMIITLVLMKIITIYNIFQNSRMLVVFIGFIVFVSSFALFIRYYLNKDRVP